jgi:hypothetical protein
MWSGAILTNLPERGNVSIAFEVGGQKPGDERGKRSQLDTTRNLTRTRLTVLLMQLVDDLETVTPTRLSGQPESAELGEKRAGVLVQFPPRRQGECQERDDGLEIVMMSLLSVTERRVIQR